MAKNNDPKQPHSKFLNSNSAGNQAAADAYSHSFAAHHVSYDGWGGGHGRHHGHDKHGHKHKNHKKENPLQTDETINSEDDNVNLSAGETFDGETAAARTVDAETSSDLGADTFSSLSSDSFVTLATGNTYYADFNSGDDIIYDFGDPSEIDVLIFDETISPADIRLEESFDHLVITHTDFTGSITVLAWFLDDDYEIEEFVFVFGDHIYTSSEVTAAALGSGLLPYEEPEPENTAPVAVDDSFDAGAGATASGNVLANDTDADGDTLTAVAGTYTTANGGTVVLESDGDFTYIAADDYVGNDEFSYTINDGNGGSDTAEAVIENIVNIINTPPVANPDSFDAGAQAIVTGNVLLNDTDADGDTLSVVPATLVTANGGTVVIESNGDFTYTAAEDFVGNDEFSYIVSDGQGGVATAEVEIGNINNFVNTAPVAVDDSFDANDQATVAGNVLLNDTDADGDTLSASPTIITTANGSTVILESDGDFTYTAAADYTGDDQFSYIVSDGQGGSDTGHVTLNGVSNPVNDAPVAADDFFDAADQATVSGNVLLNDTDEDGDMLSATPMTLVTANGGTVILQADGEFTYAAAEGYTGGDSFAYTVTDGNGGLSSATVHIANVMGEQDVPPESTPASGSVFAAIQEEVIYHEFAPGTQEFPTVMERVKLMPTSLINGVDRSSLTFQNAHEVKVSFVTEGAGYKNTLGMYTVDANGVIGNVQFLAENLSGTGSDVFGGGTYNQGDLIANLGTLPPGTEIGFFIVADGFNKNNGYNKFDSDQGHFEIRNKHTEDPAHLNDAASQTELVFVRFDGREFDIKGDVWHSTTNSLNIDGKTHAVSGINEKDTLQIGFEDLNCLGDADFNDVIIQLCVTPIRDIFLPDVPVSADYQLVDADDNTITSANIDLGGAQAGDEIFLNGITTDGFGQIAGTNIFLIQAGNSISLAGADTAENYESVIQSLTFRSTAEDPQAGDRSVGIRVTDADGLMDVTHYNVIIGEVGSQPPEMMAFDNGSDLMFAGLMSDDMWSDTDDHVFDFAPASLSGDDAYALEIGDVLTGYDAVQQALDDYTGAGASLDNPIMAGADAMNQTGLDQALANVFMSFSDLNLDDDINLAA